MRLYYASGKERFSPGTYGIRLSRHFESPRRISIGKNVPIVSAGYARPSRPLPKNAIAQMNRTAWSMSIVLNADDSFFSMVFAACSLAAARGLAIELTAEPVTGAAGITGGPATIAGRLFILGFLGFLGGFGCAHRTSGPMTRAFGRRPV